MRQFRLFFLIFGFYFFNAHSWAGSVRFATLEWKEVPNTTLYETELKDLKTNQIKYFKSKNAKLEIEVFCGRYTIKMRSYDGRGAPGPWGNEKGLVVPPAVPKLIKPLDNDEKVSDEVEETLNFQWEPLEKVTEYELTIKESKTGNTKKIKTQRSNADLALKTGKEYTWSVQAFYDDLVGDRPELFSTLQIKGAKLKAPTLDIPTHGFVTTINWENVSRAERYEVKLFKKEGSDWKTVFEDNIDVTGETLGYKFPNSFSGGTYKFQIRATGDLVIPSNINEEIFNVRTGDRSKAAYESYLFKSSLEMASDKYFVASYLITDISYKSHYIKTDVDFKALGGTGRLGFGKKKPNSDYGLYGIVDLSGFIIKDKNHLFKSGEFHGFYRIKNESAQIRFSGGLFIRDLPEIRGQSDLSNKVESVSTAGPQIGFDYWKAFTSRYGFQFNTRFYYSNLGVRVPGNTKIVPSSSYQVGVLGTFRISPRALALAGYAYRKDQISYKAEAGARDYISNINAVGDEINIIAITGHYLNLVLEIGF